MGKYILGSEQDFHNFINSISKKDKIGIVTHTDLDGIASGIFLQKILESRDLHIIFIEFLAHGPSVLKDLLNKEFDVLFFTDWNVDNYLEDLKKLRKKGKIFVIDHHPFNEDLKDKSGIVKTNSIYCSSHCLFDLAKRYIDINKWKWLVCSSIIADYVWDKADENFDLIKSVYPEVKKDSSIWNSRPGEISKIIGRALIYYAPDFRKVYDLVLKKDLDKLKDASKIVEQEIEKWLKKAREEAEYFPEQKLHFYFMNPKYNIVSITASIYSDNEFKDDVIVFVHDSPSNPDFVKISARNQSGRIDVGKLLKKCIEGFEKASAGGHAKAAAGVFPKKYLNEFKKRLLEELK